MSLSSRVQDAPRADRESSSSQPAPEPGDIGTEPVGKTPFGGRLAKGAPGLLDRYPPPEPLVLLLTALVVGIGAGLGAVCFRWLIDGVTHVSFTWLPDAVRGLGPAYLVIAPALGGLLVGWLTYRYAREAKGHGVPEVMEAVALRGGLDGLSERFRATQHHGFPVVDDGNRLVGIVTIHDLERARERDLPPGARVRDIATANPQIALPDETMAVALQRLSVRGVGRLPVVSRRDVSRLVGAVRRDDIVRAYNIALTRRAEMRHRGRQTGSVLR